MCGICGFTTYDTTDGAEGILSRMMDTIIHRGPDSEGSHLGDSIALGFRRLAMIDLDGGSQPIYSGKYVITMNGEIYNYKALRDELLLSGVEFSTLSDTEVVLKLYEIHGKDCLKYLRGMFAFVIYDTHEKRMFAARDFFGIKPFHYAQVGNDLVFGSEIKSFFHHPLVRKELNHEALEHYLTFQYSVLNETFFKGIYKLPPGHYLTFENGKLEVIRYFAPVFRPEEKKLCDTIDAISAVVKDSVEHHKVADVEVASFLSSGVDSSYVAACANVKKTFSVGFDIKDYNEIPYAKALSDKLNIENISQSITREAFFEELPRIVYHMDEPLADPAAVPLYFVSQIASKHVKIALSGEGADELFGGYNIYREPLDIKILTDLPRFVRKFLGWTARKIPFGFKGKNLLIRASKDITERFIGNANLFSKEERETIIKNPIFAPPAHSITKPVYDRALGYDDITKMQYLDINMWMVGDILLKADRMSMAHSLEVRVPFLDTAVFDVASHIQTDYRVNRVATKYAFRLAAREVLPDDVSKKKKLGFPVPIRVWLREDKIYNQVKTAFTSATAKNLFNTDALVSLLDAHKSHKSDNSRKIWAVYMFLLWHKVFFEGDETQSA